MRMARIVKKKYVVNNRTMWDIPVPEKKEEDEE